LLGERIYNESRTFFEVFSVMRERILERCEWLARFFTQSEVAVVAVATPESSAQFELEGLTTFLKQKRIPLQGIVLNQVEVLPEKVDYNSDVFHDLDPTLIEKLKQLREHQIKKAELAHGVVERCRSQYAGTDFSILNMNYADDGFEILRANAEIIRSRT
jgi:hypothetical protein